jgi:radical SAM superfamily enzyme YgiQ (UPF0313 family)
MGRVSQVDGMFVGEPEDGVVHLASLNSTEQLSEVANLTWRTPTGTIEPHRAHGSFSGFMKMPFPAWDLLKLQEYALPLVNKPYVIVETSRGCPYSCTFCQTPDFYGESKVIPLDSIERVLWTYSQQGIATANILDENFGIFPQHTKEVIRLLKKYRMLHF